MGYPAKYDPARYTYLSAVTDKMTRMKEGEHFTIPLRNPKDLENVRYDLYSWLFHHRLKKNFRIKVVEQSLIVTKGRGKPAITIQESGFVKEDEIMEKLIYTDRTEDGVRNELKEMLKRKEIEFEDVTRFFTLFGEKIGFVGETSSPSPETDYRTIFGKEDEESVPQGKL